MTQGDEIEFAENDSSEPRLPDNVRPEVLEAFFDVFEEDAGILEYLKDR